MKKLFLLFLGVLLFLVGCGKNTSGSILKDINEKFDKSSGFKLVGDLEINNNDDTYNYEVVVDYKKDDFYKVVLTNQANQFMQIILKNNDGVFLLTPSLNKSFKFQSDWPYNNSQAYLLNAVLSDLNNDSSLTFEEKNGNFIYNTKVHYSNNSKLTKQRVIFDKNYNLSKVTVYDNNDSVCMEFVVSKLKYSPKYDDDYFELDSIIDVNSSEMIDKDNSSSDDSGNNNDSNGNNNDNDNDNGDSESSDEDVQVKETLVLDDVVYPLFLPDGTKLVGEERVEKESGERVIMTYDGEKNFLLVEETLDVFNDFTVIPSLGEPYLLMDTIGVMTDNSLSWSSGNTEYYLVSDVMEKEELVEVAQSIVGVISMK